VGLDEHVVDLLEIDDAGLVSHGLDEGAEAEVAGAAQEAFAGAGDEGHGFLGEGVVAQAGAVELLEDEHFDHLGAQARQEGRVSDPGTDFLVDGQGEGLEQRGLADEHEIVGTGEVFEEQAQFAQALRGHEMGVVDDGDQHFAGAVDFEGFLDQEPLAVVVVALELDLEGFAEDAQGVVISVEGAVDDRGDQPFWVVVQKRLFEDRLAGAGLAQHQAQAALLGVDPEDVEDFLLVSQEREGFGVEGVALQAEVGADHRECGVESWECGVF
jgi:hypothetical protein